MTTALAFTVHGLPSPQGSKKGIPVKRKGGRVGVALIESAGPRVKTWRQDVRAAAEKALDDPSALHWRPTAHDALAVHIVFFLPRPKGHYRTGRNAHLLRDSAPKYPTTKPDSDKLERAVLDALTSAGVYPDDSQVVNLSSRKRYADDGRPGAFISVSHLEEDGTDPREELKEAIAKYLGRPADEVTSFIVAVEDAGSQTVINGPAGVPVMERVRLLDAAVQMQSEVLGLSADLETALTDQREVGDE